MKPTDDERFRARMWVLVTVFGLLFWIALFMIVRRFLG